MERAPTPKTSDKVPSVVVLFVLLGITRTRERGDEATKENCAWTQVPSKLAQILETSPNCVDEKP